MMLRTNSTTGSQYLSEVTYLNVVLTFPKPTYAKVLNDNEESQEDCNPDTNVDISSPELDGDSGGSEFKW